MISLSILITSTFTIQGDEKAEMKCKSYVLMEASSKTVIKAENENEKLSPASITKIMTLILIFDAIHSGKIKLEDMVTTSAHAKSMGGSQVFLEEGEQQNVETLIKCIIIASGNDASVAMAEHISGSEEEFVKEMNKRAKNLGMKHTHFEDCCGLTDSDNHYTSAMDVAIMSRELIVKYPEIFKYSTIWMESFTHKTNKGESEFMLTNTNKLLKTNRYVKGLKTGSTSKAKYCVSTVAEKDGVELIAVVMAAPDYKARFVQSNSLINYGFSNCKVYKDNKKYQNKVNICGGEKDKVKVQNDTFSYVDTKGGKIDGIESKVALKDNINAPVRKGDIVGKIEYIMDKKKIGEVKIMAEETVDKADYGFTFLKLVKYMFQIT
ncbi:D-alanyl-D-alanine carboxypeptidase [Eubacterium sp. AF15-50]|nr:D-alanyl-D-alanine carboxypeptidase [Eubacterium sp. AF16-48]RHR82084.1 D-alanyl-D-alanine carboxypeptidase [Eubacterium sp. AF15-50]